MATTAAETAVRNYLTFLSDPDSLVDASAMEELEDAAERASDPIDKLMALARLENARKADPDIYRQGFVEHAKEWAEAEGVPASAFEQLGVPRDVLQEAGVISRSGRGRPRSTGGTKGTRGKAAPKAVRAPRRDRVRPEQLEEGILALDEPFSVKDVTDRVGGSTLTVRGAIARLEGQGKIRPAGERSGSRGRASKVWTVA